MTSVMLLVFDNLVKSDFVLDEKSDFNVELVNVLLCQFILADVLDYSLAKAFEFCS